MTPHQHTLPVVHAAHLAEPCPEARWMIESLWLRAAVGIIGGAPKTNKTYLALDLALSVASGTPALGAFAVSDPGAVLIYMAEDAEATIKERLLALCHHRQLDLAALALHVITATTVRLDLESDRFRLENTIAMYRPRLLVLDPLVRLHAINENDAGEISRLLAYLRALQRSHDASIVLVHHTRKNGSASTRAGQTLRGSGDLHAWSDSSLYLKSSAEQLTLVAEHRSAPAPEPLALALLSSGSEPPNAHLEIVDRLTRADSEQRRLQDQILGLLADKPMSRAELRSALEIRNERLGHLLERLAAEARIVHSAGLWRVPFP